MEVKGKTILHVITVSSEGGAQSVVVNLANAQCIENTVYVISSPDGGAWKALDKRVNTISIKQLRKKIGPWDFVVLIKLFHYRRKLHPDIIHLHSSKMGVLGRLAFPTKKTIYTVHGFDSIRVANRRFLTLEKKLQGLCRYIVGVSRYDENNLQSEGINNNVTYVYNGVPDISEVHLSKENRQTEKFLNNLPFEKKIICIARDGKQKKIELFIDIARKMPEYAFIWIGNELDYPKPDNVFLLGMLPEAYQLLHSADLFMLCSNYEGLPMSIIEALSVGLPVVSSKVGGVHEILNEKNGIAVDNSVESFCRAIRHIFSSEQTYKKFSKEAKESYIADFTVDKMAHGYDRLYRNMIQD